MRKFIKPQMLLITCLASAGTGAALAAEYVPPPAGPYKPAAVVVSGEQNTSTEGAGKVYKFPSEDLMRSEAPSMPVLAPAREEAVKPAHHDSLRAGSAMQERTSKAPAFPSQTPANVQNPANSYAVNPWAAGAAQGQSIAPPRYQGAQQPGQVWYPQYGYPQQNPYAYGYPDYYDNSNNSADAPFTNMPSPWTMMPMQPFFPGR